MVTNAITSFLGDLIEQVMKPIREFLADTLLATPDVTQHADIQKLWKSTLGITLGIYVLFVTAGGITVMGHETVQTRYALRHIAPRLLVGLAAGTASLTVMGKAVGLSNALAHAILASDMSDAGQGLVERALPFALFGAAGIKIYLLLLAVMVLALVVAVLIGFMMRVAVMALLAVAAPLMLACHAHPVTEPVARLWWKALGGCLAIQVMQSLTFVLALKLFFAPGATAVGIPRADELGTMLAGTALFWVLFKIPGWTLQIVLRGSPASAPHAPAGLRMLKNLAMYRLLTQATPLGGLLAAGAGGRSGGFGFGPRRRPPGGGSGPAGGSGGSPGGPGNGGSPAGLPSAPSASQPGGGLRAHGQRLLSEGRAVLTRLGITPPPTAPPQNQATPPTPPPPARPGPRAVVHPAQARHRQQLALPIHSPRVPARLGQATQLWLPVPAERVPARPAAQAPGGHSPCTPGSAPRPSPGSTLPPAPPANRSPRGRQTVLPIRVDRVRVRPPRPIQLRLPLEPPRR
ncbi:hypothetical protein [Streptomyces chilikensis]|uniref:hypothetical protein n=1 Tax=Streptomyces chilikensis TaxID=1194079 RepID=UPI0014098833|nr:hypothetical protein [Streptomyces chilikensis]